MKNMFLFLLLLLAACGGRREKQILVVYQSDAPGISQKLSEIANIGSEKSIKIDTTGQLVQFTEQRLQQYSAVVLLGVAGENLNYKQQTDLERYIQSGGGLVGIDTDMQPKYQWPWYSSFLAQIDQAHNPDGFVARQINLTQSPEDKTHLEGTYQFDGGRLCFLSSTQEEQLGDYLSFAIGNNNISYRKVKSPRVPEDSRFTRIVLDNDLNEPMELDILPDGKVIFIERRGPVKLYDPVKNTTELLAQFDVCNEGNYEDGMLGIALDPQFRLNRRLYIYYSAPVDSVQRLSRFFLAEDSLVMDSEKTILEVPVQRETCCHSGGSVQFGPDGLLYLSTGDNTSSKESNGYTPLDERPGRGPFDAQKSSGNTHDLRGKVLRIRVNEDGSYSIPDGNLFPKDGSQGKPEIYAMGCRNPFRISIDYKTGYLYWGDVGPDSGVDSEQGPQSYDEWNQAREPGFYGWPYFEADNKAFPDFDFVSNTPGPYFDPEHPVNDSPNNYGSRDLPPAKMPMIWYPYGESELWPILGTGSRSAMAGPVYYSDRYFSSSVKFPSYYDGKLFIYEWSRSWIMVVSFDEQQHLNKIEPFMPDMPLSKPIDMEFGPDGAMYLLEYGANYFAKNDEARLVKIEYAEGNRAPVPQVVADKEVGGVPLEVQFSAAKSYDYDEGDSLQYAWIFTGDEIQASGATSTYTFTEPGVYTPKVIVMDNEGGSTTAEVEIKVGNDRPQIDFTFDGNQSFFYDDETLRYEVALTDKEDGSLNNGIDSANVKLQFNYLSKGKDLALLGANAFITPFAKGKSLMDESDCKSCHSLNLASVGPSYLQIADRYNPEDQHIASLAQKVITGGNGNWGHSLMAAHPQHTMEETSEMVRYILSLGEEQHTMLGMQGVLQLNKHEDTGEEGTYILSAAYKDQGSNGMPAITSRKTVKLRHPRVQAEDYEDAKGVQRIRPNGGSFAFVGGRIGSNEEAYFVFRDVDLSYISAITFNASSRGASSTIALHLDAPDGKKVGEAGVVATEGRGNFIEVTSDITSIKGIYDLYFVIEKEGEGEQAFFGLDWMYFHADTSAPALP